MTEAEGKTQNYVCRLTEITHIKEHQQQLERIAHYDALTTLPNRVLLADRLRQSMAQGLRHGSSLIVAYLDLDGAQIMIDQRQAGDPRDWVAAETAYPYGRGMSLEISVAAVAPLFETCTKQGARIFLPLEDKWYRRDDILLGCRQFIVMDPDGYPLRFSQSLGTRPAEGGNENG